MVHPLFRRRDSFAKAPDYSAKADTLALLRKEKATPTEADYKPAQVDSKKRCHECKFYEKYGEPKSSCTKIIGVVVAEGTCDYWSQRDYNTTDTNKGTTIVVEVHRGG